MASRKRNIGLEILKGIQQLKRGEHARVINVPSVASIREKTGLSQPQFAELLGASVRTLQEWEQGRGARAGGTYQVGQVHQGRVTRIAEFGAFVELEVGIEALAHVSTFAPAGQLRQGMTGAFEIVSIEPEKRRIGVAPAKDAIQDAQETEAVRDYAERGNEAPAEAFGSLADKLRHALKPREK